MKLTTKGRFLGVVVGISMVSSLFAFDKVLYIVHPKPGPTTNVYPQEESVGFFINQMLHVGLAALPGWLIVSEMPTNTNNMILFRLETTYTLSGSVSRPDCVYAYRLYNENNRLLFQTNVTSDIARGMLDAVDVAIFGAGRAVGQDLSQFAFATLTVPTFDGENYHLYLNRNKIADLTNREPLSLRYRLMANETYTLSLREPPSLFNLWLGSTIWQTNIFLLRGQSANIPIEPMTAITIRPLRTEVFFPGPGRYLLNISSLQNQITNNITNIVLPLGRTTNLVLPLGRIYDFDIVYSPRNLAVSSDDVSLQRTSYTYHPIDRIQTRPLYLSVEAAGHVAFESHAQATNFLLPFVRGGATLYYYPFMNQRLGVRFVSAVFPSSVANLSYSGTVSTVFAQWGIYPFSKKYQPLRWYVEAALGWQMSHMTFDARDPQIDAGRVSSEFNRMMSGFKAEVSTGIEWHFLSVGGGVWAAPRTGFFGNTMLYGISLFVKTLL